MNTEEPEVASDIAEIVEIAEIGQGQRQGQMGMKLLVGVPVWAVGVPVGVAVGDIGEIVNSGES